MKMPTQGINASCSVLELVGTCFGIPTATYKAKTGTKIWLNTSENKKRKMNSGMTYGIFGRNRNELRNKVRNCWKEPKTAENTETGTLKKGLCSRGGHVWCGHVWGGARRFSHARKGKRPFQRKPSTKAVFPFSRGKNRISQGVENRGSLTSVPLALREYG